MSNFANLFKILKSSPSIIYPSFPVDDSHVIDPPSKPLQFKKDEVYFEIRICEQFLKNKREYLLSAINKFQMPYSSLAFVNT